jgi:AcrR family transcriptional regulator
MNIGSFMQKLKDDLREIILCTAEQAFFEDGFEQVSMRNIAQKAGMATGNLYHYYSSKEDLFTAIIEPVYSQITGLIENQKVHAGETPQELVHELGKLTRQLTILVEHSHKKLVILLNKSGGTPYQSTKELLVKFLSAHIEDELVQYYLRKGEKNEPAMAHPLAASFLEGIFAIINTTQDENTINRLISEYIQVFYPLFEQFT